MKNINYILAVVLFLFQNCNANSEIDRSIADTNSIGQGPINFVEAAKRVTPAVVHINTFTTQQQQRDLGPFEEFFEEGDAQQDKSQNQEKGEMRLQGAGSGVILTEDGYIITSNHIIQEAERIEVSLEDKRVYTASVVGTDPSTDLAVIKIEEKNLPIVEFGNSEELEVGQWVVAIGNPFELTSTVTAGIVSAKGRNLNILQGQEQRGIESFIQTDAAANPGNSGGALVNKDGLLVGIIAAIASPTGSFAGYSFAVPENLTRKVF
ncbi:MAG: S1C family serine protease, partial [Cytophagaceae bacterium]